MAINPRIARRAGWSLLFWTVVLGGMVSPPLLHAHDFSKVYIAHNVGCPFTNPDCTPPPDVVSVIDTHSDRVIATLTVGVGPVFARPTPDGHRVYVVNAGSGEISVIDAKHDILKTPILLEKDSNPQAVAFSEDGRRAFVTNFFNGVVKGTVSVISVAKKKVIDTVREVGFGTLQPLVFGHNLYVTNLFEATVSVIDTQTNQIVATIPVGQSPLAIAAVGRSSPRRRHHDQPLIFVANFGDGLDDKGGVSVIDPRSNTVVDTISVGTGPLALAASQDGRFLYVANFLSNDVSVVRTETREVVATIPVPSESEGQPVGQQPLGLALTSDDRRLLVLHTDVNAVLPGGLTIVSTKEIRRGENPILATIAVGPLASDTVSAQDKAYVPNSDGPPCTDTGTTGTVSVIDVREGKLETTIEVDPCPFVGTVVVKQDEREDKPHHGKGHWRRHGWLRSLKRAGDPESARGGPNEEEGRP